MIEGDPQKRRCVFKSAIELDATGVKSFQLVTAGRKFKFPVEQIYSVAFNSSRGTVTFCWPNPEGEIKYSTFSRSRLTSFRVIPKKVHPAVLSAEAIIKPKGNP